MTEICAERPQINQALRCNGRISGQIHLQIYPTYQSSVFHATPISFSGQYFILVQVYLVVSVHVLYKDSLAEAEGRPINTKPLAVHIITVINSHFFSIIPTIQEHAEHRVSSHQTNVASPKLTKYILYQYQVISIHPFMLSACDNIAYLDRCLSLEKPLLKILRNTPRRTSGEGIRFSRYI